MMLDNTSVERIKEIRERQGRFFRSGVTLDVKWRLERIKAFEAAVRKWEKPLCEALWTDLHKSYEEAYLTVVSILLGEIRGKRSTLSESSTTERSTGLRVILKTDGSLSADTRTAVTGTSSLQFRTGSHRTLL